MGLMDPWVPHFDDVAPQKVLVRCLDVKCNFFLADPFRVHPYERQAYVLLQAQAFPALDQPLCRNLEHRLGFNGKPTCELLFEQIVEVLVVGVAESIPLSMGSFWSQASDIIHRDILDDARRRRRFGWHR